MALFTYVFAQMECENVVIYGDTAHSFRSQNFANAVIDGDAIQKCRYLRRCETKNAIIYVCYSADRVQKCRYLRRYSTFFSESKYTNVVIDGDAIQKCRYLRRWEPKNGIIYEGFCADGVRKCRYVRRYSAFFSEPKYTNVVTDGYGKQKCRYLRRCKTKYAIIYVCFCADGVRKYRYVRRYSTFFSESKYTNVVIDGDGKQKCSYLRRCETKYAIIYVCFCADGMRKCRYLRRYSTFFSEPKYTNVRI